jgi:Ca2+-dependent lipid-binding protein
MQVIFYNTSEKKTRLGSANQPLEKQHKNKTTIISIHLQTNDLPLQKLQARHLPKAIARQERFAGALRSLNLNIGKEKGKLLL